jgi:hypothetical protein
MSYSLIPKNKIQSNNKIMATEKTFWISYDLGIRGDYAGLYNWLDNLGAQECGDSLAVVKTKVSSDIVAFLKRDIKKKVKIAPTDRIYLIYRDGNTGSVKGSFLFGGRKRALWEGQGQTRHQGMVEDY